MSRLRFQWVTTNSLMVILKALTFLIYTFKIPKERVNRYSLSYLLSDLSYFIILSVFCGSSMRTFKDVKYILFNTFADH